MSRQDFFEEGGKDFFEEISDSFAADFRESDNRQQLLQACHDGDVAKAHELISFGVDPRFCIGSSGFTPLMMVCLRSKNVDLVRTILTGLHEKCDSLNDFVGRDSPGGINAVNVKGESALFFACRTAKDEIIKVLIDERADTSIKSPVETSGGEVVEMLPFDILLHLNNPDDRRRCVNSFVKALAVTQRYEGEDWSRFPSSTPTRYYERTADLLDNKTKKLLATILPDGLFYQEVLRKLSDDDQNDVDYLRRWARDLDLSDCDKNRAVAIQLGFGDEFPSIDEKLAVRHPDKIDNIRTPLAIPTRKEFAEALELLKAEPLKKKQRTLG